MVSITRAHDVGDRRRKRLTQLLNHESEKVSSSSSPTVRGARSLPALPSFRSTKNAMLTDFDLNVTLVPPSEQGPLLSPLKFTRRASGTSTDKAFVSPEHSISSEALHTEAVLPNTAMSSMILKSGTLGTHPSTRDVFTPKDDKTQRRSREWIKSDTALLHQQREVTREKYAQRLEITRRRTAVAAASQSFFNRLAFLPTREAIQLFEAQREALLDFCLQQFRGQVEGDELKTIHTDLLKMMDKEYKDLQLRLNKLKEEERQTAQKQQARQSLKKSHQDQIERHLSTAIEKRKQELAARAFIVKEQERLDKNYEALQVERKHLTESHNEKLVEQIKNNAVVQSTFKLAVQGSSPLYRTPWWSDESDERLKGFQRPMTVQALMQSPVIHSKHRCQWYD
ncbi:uncharacterized protein IUM83_05691 [Phytophthora cinnamomi]|uniref:uncharacterized protein n=1 Tax=Phytophthora cinnamomi TaxID=4785 RepID=UPI00355AB1E9|nr:hypothetical protein IUM83_05691 [Phytophthora cinnamomi]